MLQRACRRVIGVHLNAQILLGLGQRQSQREIVVVRHAKLGLEKREHLIQCLAQPLAVENLVRNTLTAIERVEVADILPLDSRQTADFRAAPDGGMYNPLEYQHVSEAISRILITWSNNDSKLSSRNIQLPSHKAEAGSLCTSMNRPESTPVATAALAR